MVPESQTRIGCEHRWVGIEVPGGEQCEHGACEPFIDGCGNEQNDNGNEAQQRNESEILSLWKRAVVAQNANQG